MRSKVALTVVSLILIFTFSVVAKEKKGNAGTPKLVMAEQDHHFGVVKPGTPLTYSFKVKNTGDADLEITKVAPGCGCTTSDFDKVIAPGKEGKITLEIKNTEGYKGEIVKNATVTTNDPERQTFTLMLRANFVSE